MSGGDKEKFLGGSRAEGPRLIRERNTRARGYAPPEPPARRQQQREPGEVSPGMRQWIAACRGGKQSPGSFLNAGPISDAVNLYGVALRTRQRLLFDGETRKITNVADADKYLSREYRKGWAPV